jgi:7,8-dihydroneopterin aldolase/epimerase/oxygenase
VTDTVSIRGITVQAVIGVYDWEREISQELVVSADMSADVRKAAASDDLADAHDYSAIAETIRRVLEDGRFQLIETAAERIAEAIRERHGVVWTRVEVVKPLPDGYSSAVTIERGSRP